jgi:hypothetical protein
LGHKVLGFAGRECAAWGGHSRAGAASQGCSKRNHLLQAPAKGTGASLNHTGEKRTIGVTDKICILAALLCLTASGSSQGFVGCPIYNVGLLRTSDGKLNKGDGASEGKIKDLKIRILARAIWMVVGLDYQAYRAEGLGNALYSDVMTDLEASASAAELCVGGWIGNSPPRAGTGAQNTGLGVKLHEALVSLEERDILFVVEGQFSTAGDRVKNCRSSTLT